MFQIDTIGPVKCPTAQLSDALENTQIKKKDENLSGRQATADLKAPGEYCLVNAFPIMVGLAQYGDVCQIISLGLVSTCQIVIILQYFTQVWLIG